MIKNKKQYWNKKVFAENLFILIFCIMFIACFIGYIKILNVNIRLY